jgi:PAS domain S-box-containing protein
MIELGVGGLRLARSTIGDSAGKPYTIHEGRLIVVIPIAVISIATVLGARLTQLGPIAAGMFDIVLHASLLGMFCLAVGWLRSELDQRPGAVQLAGWSLAFGLMAAISMLAPTQPMPNLRIDIRATMIVLALLFGRWPSAVIVTSLELGIRWLLGGSLALTGMVGIVLVAASSILCLRALRVRVDDLDWRRLGVMGLVAGLAGPAASFFTHPPAEAWQLVIAGGPVNVIAVLLSVVVFTAIIRRTDEARRDHRALRDRQIQLSEANSTLNELAVKLERRNQDYQQALLRAEGLTTQMQAIFDHAPIGIYIKDRNGIFIAANEPAAAAVNQTVAAVLDHASSDFLEPSDAARAQADDRTVLESGEVVSSEFRANTPGAPKWIWTVKFPIRDGSGEVTAIGGFDLDISHRKLQELALQRSALLLRRLQRISRINYWYHEIDEQLQQRRLPGSPDDFYQMTGWHADEVLKGDFYLDHVVHPIDRERMREIYRAFRSGETDSYVCEYNIICADGRVLPVKVWVERVRQEDGEGSYVIGAMQDVSDQRQRERRLLDAMSRAEMSDRIKSDFLANLSHELRTPLNAVIGFSDLLKMALAGNQQASEYLDAINSSGQHLLGSIDDLLAMADLEEHVGALAEEMIDVGLVVRECVAEAAARAGKPELRFITEGLANGIGLFAEPLRFHQALAHLLANAAKFTPAGGLIKTIIRIQPGGNLQVTVADDGCGIDSDLLPQLAAPFVHGGNAYSRRHGGIGIGLATCRKIMDLHGGRLVIDSVLRQGTEVSLVFPAARIAAKEVSAAAIQPVAPF